MADLATQLFKLVSDAGILALYPTIAPQGAAMPYSVWQVISSTPETTHDTAPAGFDDVLIQITSIGSTPAEARAERKRIRAVLDGATLADGSPITIEGEHDQYDQAVDASVAVLEIRTSTDALS